MEWRRCDICRNKIRPSSGGVIAAVFILIFSCLVGLTVSYMNRLSGILGAALLAGWFGWLMYDSLECPDPVCKRVNQKLESDNWREYNKQRKLKEEIINIKSDEIYKKMKKVK
jgi:hypothetical protein